MELFRRMLNDSIRIGIANDASSLRKLSLLSNDGRQRTARTAHLLHNATKRILARAVQGREAIVLENIRGIRRLYQRGNGQKRKYRGRMNGLSFGEVQRQIEYKARWIGLPVIRLSRRETRGSSVTCPRCGETPIGQATGTQALVRKMQNSNGPGQGGGGQPGSAGTGEVRTFPAPHHPRGARRSS